MRLLDVQSKTGAPEDAGETMRSLCSLMAGGRSFGIDTCGIREVLGKRGLQRVPLAPAWIGGVLPYRGEVLTTVSFRALLGLPPLQEQGVVLVLDGNAEEDRFGLEVDSVGGVVMVSDAMLAPNPSTLEERGKLLFDGAYRLAEGLLVRLDPERLRPGRLSECGLFGHAACGAEMIGDAA